MHTEYMLNYIVVFRKRLVNTATTTTTTTTTTTAVTGSSNFNNL